MPRFYYSINLWIFVLNSPSLPSPCLQQNTKNYESNANIEWEVQFPCLAEEKEGKQNGVAWLKVVGEVHGKRWELLQGLDLQQIHADGAEQGMAEHPP